LHQFKKKIVFKSVVFFGLINYRESR